MIYEHEIEDESSESSSVASNIEEFTKMEIEEDVQSVIYSAINLMEELKEWERIIEFLVNNGAKENFL